MGPMAAKWSSRWKLNEVNRSKAHESRMCCDFEHPRYKRDVRPKGEAKATTNMTYDSEADAMYITVGRGTVDRTEETGPFIYDVDGEGHILGIEILSASKVLAPGDWKKAHAPGEARVSAAE
jgi:uncharacterized protein YuzE